MRIAIGCAESRSGTNDGGSVADGVALAQNQNYIQQRFGEVVDLGACLVGKNLNLVVLRGHARLDALAAISAPDWLDQTSNPNGLQRGLKPKHAEQCLDYAIEGSLKPPEERPAFFPEILLNARDAQVIELYNIHDPSDLYDFDSFSDLAEIEVDVVGVKVLVSAIEFPKKDKNPQISRVDGNHRLHETDAMLIEAINTGESIDVDFPPVAFSLLIGLSWKQEGILFRDINAEHEGMPVTHLDALTLGIEGEALKSNPKTLPLWLAKKLSGPDRAFEGMVYLAGKDIKKELGGALPPVRINSLKTTIAQQLKSAPTVETKLSGRPELVLNILDNFWKAVRAEFPEAWADKSNYILLQAIGLGAFAKFGGMILDNAFKEKAVGVGDFQKHLRPVANRVSLDREKHPGVAGAGGANLIYKMLVDAYTPEDITAEWVIEALGGSKSIEEQLGAEGTNEPPEAERLAGEAPLASEGIE